MLVSTFVSAANFYIKDGFKFINKDSLKYTDFINKKKLFEFKYDDTDINIDTKYAYVFKKYKLTTNIDKIKLCNIIPKKFLQDDNETIFISNEVYAKLVCDRENCIIKFCGSKDKHLHSFTGSYIILHD